MFVQMCLPLKTHCSGFYFPGYVFGSGECDGSGGECGGGGECGDGEFTPEHSSYYARLQIEA